MASRNRLLRFFASFVATWGGYRGAGEQSGQNDHSAEFEAPELATANFAEFLFQKLSEKGYE